MADRKLQSSVGADQKADAAIPFVNAKENVSTHGTAMPTFDVAGNRGPDGIGVDVSGDHPVVAPASGKPSSVAGGAVGFQCVPSHRPLPVAGPEMPRADRKEPLTLAPPATNFRDAWKVIQETRGTVRDARGREMTEVSQGVAKMTAPGYRNALVACAWTLDKAGLHAKANSLRAEADRLTSRIGADGNRSPLSHFASAARQEIRNVGTGFMGLNRAGNLAEIGALKKGAAGLAQEVSVVAGGVAKSEDFLAGLRHRVADAARSVGADGVAKFMDSRVDATKAAAASNRGIADKADHFAADINKGLVIQGPPDPPLNKR